ncbi:TlpA family protein disulfide reductase [Sansalvadorimonas sp. 2012CJ34-2]|uniref:TlpA family protein disulfide reductase n=1 Tax=Parendozoicomonas callyspongiae TaxID=2942213 RepID=A0ABT0PH19_9GAMM|nr:TlpA disulfide reductase family protein [Sansalvadorimonas sp. 2012CJ34-2]MCL6270679.1 TlpA family protein disulfide reductase [Sansalvadorimonas sp. 2012CJ34-2]
MRSAFPKRLWFLFLGVLFLSGCSQEVQLEDFHGNPLHLKAKDQSWLVVNYWATWCDPCREEVPELNALAAADNGIRVWGVDFDNASPPAHLADLDDNVSLLGINFPVVSPVSVADLGIDLPPVLPATYILDAQGQLKKKLLGPQTQKGLEQAVAELAAELKAEQK